MDTSHLFLLHSASRLPDAVGGKDVIRDARRRGRTHLRARSHESPVQRRPRAKLHRARDGVRIVRGTLRRTGRMCIARCSRYKVK